MNLTKSDLINIEALKSSLKMINNDIKEVKQGDKTPEEKMKYLMLLHRQRAQLITAGNKNYSHINWIDEAIGPDTSFNRSLIDTTRIKAEQRAVFNYNQKLNLN